MTSLEATAIGMAIAHWRKYVRCTCRPTDVTGQRKGYDLECPHKHVEVKGTRHRCPRFRTLTKGEFDAARQDRLFELWLISDIRNETGVFHIIKRKDVLSSAKQVTQWHLPLGPSRLKTYRAVAVKRETKKRR